MRRRGSTAWVAAALLVAVTNAASAAAADTGDGPMQQCRTAIDSVQQTTRLPDQLLNAIGLIESGRIDPATGRRGPWPWTINAEGIGRFFATKPEAIAAVQALQARGVRSIDVGCMQVNLLFHPDAFASLDEAFDPVTNVAYAARFLSSLYAESGDWVRAAGSYHSRTPEFGAAYAASLAAFWPRAAAIARGSDNAALTLAGIAAPFAALLREPGPAILPGAVPLPAALAAGPSTTTTAAAIPVSATASALPSIASARDWAVALPAGHAPRPRRARSGQ